ncbi:MAG: DUF3303 domain-containing protein [Candidatus Hodarchaeales archaeon]|jgi:hypothetical protein
MKYILFWEIKPEDMEKAVKKYLELPEEYAVTVISENYTFAGQSKGFQLMETDDPERIIRTTLYYTPELKLKLMPIIEASKVVEVYQNMKK